jgi:hypothetical protein
MANLLLIAGGHNQRELAYNIITSGHTLILVDPQPSGPCVDLASVHIQCDTRHYLDILNEIRNRNLPIDGVTSDQSDASLLSVSIVSEYLGLPHTPSEMIKSCLDKLIQSKILYAQGICVPLTDQLSVGLVTETPSACERYFNCPSKKAIIKPSDSQGSKGVQLVNRQDELASCIYATARETSNGRILIQEYISGPEYSVDALISSNIFYTLAVASKYHYTTNPCIDERNTFFGDIPDILLSELVNTAKNAAAALNLNETLIHAELILNSYDGKVYLIEISPRGGGGSISSKIIPYLTGFNTSNFLIEKALGSDTTPPPQRIVGNPDKYVVMRFLPELNCTFQTLRLSMPQSCDLIHAELPDGPGSSGLIRDSRDRIGYFVIGSDDLDLLIQEERRMLDSLQIQH